MRERGPGHFWVTHTDRGISGNLPCRSGPVLRIPSHVECAVNVLERAREVGNVWVGREPWPPSHNSPAADNCADKLQACLLRVRTRPPRRAAPRWPRGDRGLPESKPTLSRPARAQAAGAIRTAGRERPGTARLSPARANDPAHRNEQDRDNTVNETAALQWPNLRRGSVPPCCACARRAHR